MRPGVVLAAALTTLAVAGSQASKAATFDPDPVFPVGPISAKVSHQILGLDHVASALAGRHATVNCWSDRDWTRLLAWRGAHHLRIDAEGLTFPATHRIQLAPFVCQILQQALARSARQPLYTAAAVTVLAHESAHASGIRAENRAECRAIRTEPRAAQLLGVPRALAVRMQHIFRGTIYPTELPRYRIPACKAGLPVVVVPDTLGTAANLRPLRHAATVIAHALSAWRNLGGSVGPLSPCAPIMNRTAELARFSDTLLGPEHASVAFAAASIRTRKDFATALARSRSLARCDLALMRREIRESHSGARISLGRIPASIARLSSAVRAYREIWAFRGQRWNRDSILVFDRAERTMTELFFRTSARQHLVSLELRATAAILRAQHVGG